MTIVHVTDQIGSFYFKRIKGKDTLNRAIEFCKDLSRVNPGLKGYISQTVN